MRILRIAWNFFLASSNAASGSSIRHISIAAMDFPYLACHPHRSQKVAVVRQSNKTPSPIQGAGNSIFLKKMCKITPLGDLDLFFLSLEKKKWFLEFSITIFQRQNIRTIARFLYHVQVGSQWYRRMSRFFYFHNSSIAKFGRTFLCTISNLVTSHHKIVLKKKTLVGNLQTDLMSISTKCNHHLPAHRSTRGPSNSPPTNTWDHNRAVAVMHASAQALDTCVSFDPAPLDLQQIKQ